MLNESIIGATLIEPRIKPQEETFREDFERYDSLRRLYSTR